MMRALRQKLRGESMPMQFVSPCIATAWTETA